MIRIKRDYPLVVYMGLFCLLITVLFGCGGPQEKINTNDVKNESTFKTSQKKDFKTISANEQVILCFGNSLTEGYGLKEEEAYPALLQQKIDAAGFKYKVVNAGLSGETTSGGLGRLNWVLNSYSNIKIFLLELGPNDGLRGIPLSTTTKSSGYN